VPGPREWQPLGVRYQGMPPILRAVLGARLLPGTPFPWPRSPATGRRLEPVPTVRSWSCAYAGLALGARGVLWGATSRTRPLPGWGRGWRPPIAVLFVEASSALWEGHGCAGIGAVRSGVLGGLQVWSAQCKCETFCAGGGWNARCRPWSTAGCHGYSHGPECHSRSGAWVATLFWSVAPAVLRLSRYVGRTQPVGGEW